MKAFIYASSQNRTSTFQFDIRPNARSNWGRTFLEGLATQQIGVLYAMIYVQQLL